ncbi:MAG: L-seryl-tRNA(Sec) selenium transferase [Sphaerochaetaceae bacterium]|nr:L-seryl-tRNA(Sec) selenium transferase [Sphaerochaetaceae bacterium]
MNEHRPRIPQVETLLQEPSVSRWIPLISRPMVTMIVREELQKIRQSWIEDKKEITHEELLDRIVRACVARYRRSPQRVVNCTGVIIHTNLGRSPIAHETWDAAGELNTAYSSLELDLDTGKRGQRNSLAGDLLSLLAGAESAMVVNNNAAALFLILSVLAKRKEVIVSRGELVQIGGGFRIPDILRQSGARLVEVGTTNITTCEDYLEAVTERTALVLKVHRSNFALRGFTGEPTTAELATALEGRVPLLVDQGSGIVRRGMPGEPPIEDHIRQGASLVCFSADKALGSVQAGCIVGTRKMITKLLQSPLYRVLRPGKTILTLLAHSLVAHLNGDKPPVLTCIDRSVREQQEMGIRVLEGLPEGRYSLASAPMTLGGGSSPDEYREGVAIRVLLDRPAEEILRRLRSLDPPIIGTIDKKVVLLHLGALFEEDVPYLRNSLRALAEW